MKTLFGFFARVWFRFICFWFNHKRLKPLRVYNRVVHETEVIVDYFDIREAYYCPRCLRLFHDIDAKQKLRIDVNGTIISHYEQSNR